ncbi:MAG: hypothetical protein ICV54_26175 [Nostoc sp. C3-bin3]|nr:hypothetical protein [Nostoc sp. C3-bin3]
MLIVHAVLHYQLDDAEYSSSTENGQAIAKLSSDKPVPTIASHRIFR